MPATAIAPRPHSKAEKATQSVVDTIIFSLEDAKKWKLPKFQRPLRVNQNVIDIGVGIKERGGIIPGVITFGVFDGVIYLLDGQHRREGFLLSECQEGMADTRTCYFDSMAEMAAEYRNLQKSLVVWKPDDTLRSMECGSDLLRRIRRECPFLGYAFFRAQDSSPILSMSTAMRVWIGSAAEAPRSGQTKAEVLVDNLSEDSTDSMIEFMNTCYGAWKKDTINARLYGTLNLMLCAWLYRRTVIDGYSARSVRMTKEQFRRCLMEVALDQTYLDWLVGRGLNERDRTPAYSRLRDCFVRSIQRDTGVRAAFPKPEWAGG